LILGYLSHQALLSGETLKILEVFDIESSLPSGETEISRLLSRRNFREGKPNSSKIQPVLNQTKGQTSVAPSLIFPRYV
jgi:hypothetical protein